MNLSNISQFLTIIAAFACFNALSEARSTARLNGTIIPQFRIKHDDLAAGPSFRSGFVKNYEEERSSVLMQEELKAVGGHLQLTPQESRVHDIFMRQKSPEMERGWENAATHAPGMHFFKAKHLVESSKVLQFLKQMPKGAVLHMHNTASVSSKWVVQTLTRMPGVLSCHNADGVLILTFRKDSKKHQCRTPYVEVAKERSKARSVNKFDEELERHINLYTSQPEIEYSDINKAWRKFQNFFKTIGDVLTYLPAFRAFHTRMLEEMHEDRIMYGEIRMYFRALIDEKGATVTQEQAIQELINIVNNFKKTHPDFFGIKIIFAAPRTKTKDAIRADFELFKKWHALHPDFIIGFDLVGQEDAKQSALHNFIDVLQDMPSTAKFFFHAGETNWYGTSVDLNMLDAILMNTHRIGHGYALLKHPVMRKRVQDHQIALEVSPLSNQILNLVWDLRNHPAGFFLSEDVPMVITNDDPGFWGVKGLSYDMYYAIMSFAPTNAGLKTLKNLVWNSIKYTALSQKEKNAAFAKLTQQWNKFLDQVEKGKVVKL